MSFQPEPADNSIQLVPSAWAHTVPDLYALLKTSPEGLTEEEALRRLAQFGPNEFGKHLNARALRVFARQFASPLIFLLIGASIITIVLKEWADTVVIMLAVFVNTGLGFYQEYKAENTLDKLTAYIKERVRVMRKGRIREIASSALVPGDIIYLSYGSRVPADARLISVNNFAADEAVLTGESLPVVKNTDVVSEGAGVTDRLGMVFAGSLTTEGYASAVVTATGDRTEIGRIAKLVSEVRREKTPLQLSLSRLSWIIFAGVSIIVAGLFLLGLYRGEPFLEMLLLSAAVAVGAIPEALPIALTVILAKGVERIAGKRGIMRSLGAAETLGSTTLIMTDKTGTLTQAKMQVTDILTKAQLVLGAAGTQVDLTKLSTNQKAILSGALLSTDAVVENSNDVPEKWRFIGRPLERHIALAAHAAGVDVPSVIQDRRVSLLPFNSTSKLAVALDTQTKHIYVLGAPDILLARSDVSKDEYIAIESNIQRISAKGGLLVGVARGTPKKVGGVYTVEASELHGLEFLGVVTLYDPVRDEAKETVKHIESHGASVVMLTGDLKGTAMAIARDIGWDITEANVMTGEELRQFSDEELMKRLSLVRIFARVTPEDKLRIGHLYQSRGEVIAMTGDGVNDAPALKAADIGIALGSGSDVAKSAADLVLLDDNFKTIVLSIEEGRRIISNIRKAFVYLMSNSLDEVFLIGGSLVMGLPLPLTAIQIIWVNFFTGSLPGLSYAFEKNRDVDRGRVAQISIFDRSVRILALGIGTLSSILLFLLYWALLSSGTELSIARTVLFLCFSSYILVIAFSFKSLHRPLFQYPIFDNKELNMSILIAATLIVCSMAIPPLRDLLGLSLISFAWLWLIAAWLICNVLLVEGVKWFLGHTGHVSARAR